MESVIEAFHLSLVLLFTKVTGATFSSIVLIIGIALTGAHFLSVVY